MLHAPTPLSVSLPAADTPKPQPPLPSQLAVRPALHQYACQRCRSRRVKCDKILSGCANCAGHRAQCIYSARRPRKPQRLQQYRQATHRSSLPASEPPTVNRSGRSRAEEVGGVGTGPGSDHSSGISERSDDEDDEGILPQELRDTTFKAADAATHLDRGRLLIGPKGMSRYLGSEKVKELACLETVLSTGPSQAEERGQSRRRDNLGAVSLLDSTHDKQDLNTYHPPAEVMRRLWENYRRNVDMMVKVLYKPPVEALVLQASKDLGSVDDSETTLLFAIWFAATSSMSAEDCQQVHNGEKRAFVRKYRYALEQSLAQAGWMTTQNILVLQSLALYLVFASENSRSTWILTGIALSLAQAMGMHSDSSLFSLSLVETELRRRVWWILCQIDIRVSENCGLQSHVPFHMDTKLPMNINDSDLESSRGPTLSPLDEFTEIVPTLCKIEKARTTLLFQRSQLSETARVKIIQEQINRYETVYLKYFDGQSGLHVNSELLHLYSLGVRLLIVRLWRLMYDASDSKPDNEEFQEQLILCDAELLGIAHQLPSRYRKYGWFFRCRYTQWHAMANLLTRLCKYTEGPAVDRAWQVVDATFADWEENGITRVPDKQENFSKRWVKTLWQPLLRLLGRARNAQKQAQKSQQGSLSADTPSSLSTGYNTSSYTPDELQHPLEMPDGLKADPFFGSVEDLSTEMNWDQLDDWVHDFREDLYQQNMNRQDKDMVVALDWW